MNRSSAFVAVLLASAACGEVKGNKLADAPPGIGDDGLVDVPSIDAPPPRCDPAKPFGTPVAVPELNSGGADTFAWLSADELTVLFASTRAGGAGDFDVYVATRADRTATFGASALLAGVNTAGRERRAMMTSDGLALYAETRLNANAAGQISRASRASTASAFGALSPITGLNAVGNSGTPFVTGDASVIYFGSDRVTAGDYNLFVATGTAGSFGAPGNVAGTSLNTASQEDSPTLTPDQLTLYFASDRAGNSGNDVWMATRTSLATGFGAPVNVSTLNTGVTEVPTWISADNCVIYFYREVGTVASNLDIYRATKPL